MTPAEQIAKDTWYRIKDSWQYSVRLGEEAITGLLVLDFLRSKTHRVARIYQSTSHIEARYGFDLLIVIKTDDSSAIMLAVQAKKLYGNIYGNNRYDHLEHKVGFNRQRQIDQLECFARNTKCIPFYLLYNYIHLSAGELQKYWHCGQPPCEEQFGCTLVPIRRIRTALGQRGCRNFHYIHRKSDDPLEEAYPWRCVFDCDHNCDHKNLSCGLKSRFGAATRRVAEQGDESALCEGLNSDSALDIESNLVDWPISIWDKLQDSSTLSEPEFYRLVDLAPRLGQTIRAWPENFVPWHSLPRWIVMHDGTK